MNVQEVQSTISVSAASAGWTAWLASANEILITIATVVAIVTGVWALVDRIRGKIRESKKSKQREAGRVSGDGAGHVGGNR